MIGRYRIVLTIVAWSLSVPFTMPALAFIAAPRELAAQQTVYPDYSTTSAQAAGTSFTSFQLVNNDPSTWFVDLSCVAEGEVTSCSVDPTSSEVPGISEQTVYVTFTTGAEGTGRVTLIAGSAQGVLDVTVTPAGPLWEVSPDGASVTAPPGQQRRQAFTVLNNTGDPLYARLVAACSGTGIDASTCTASAARLFLRAGESSPVTVRYATQPAAGSGIVVLRLLTSGGSSVLDTGYVNVTVSAPSLAMVRIAPSTPGVTLERDQCVTFSLRREAAAECGVLRIVHPLPGVRTRSTGRTPTLLYYYDLAFRERPIGIDVTMAPAATYQADDSVRISILQRVGGQCINPSSKTYSAAHWFTGTPGARSRRVGVVIPLESSGDSYIRQYCVDAALLRSGAPQPLAPLQYGEFSVVQRYNTAFGAGWWLAGLEELYFNQPDSIGGANAAILWIGGDGSTRRYRCRPTGCNGIYFPADTIDRIDSLVLSGGEYTRYLPHGLKVVFDATGRHVRTVNRHGAVTTFSYSGTTRRLLSISVPPAGSGLSFNFVYDGSNTLIRVDAPGVPTGTVRSVTLQRSGLAVTGFVDPDNRAVSFQQPAWAGSNGTLIERMLDRRGVGTYFYQEGHNPAVGSVYTALAGGQAQWQWFRTPAGLSAPPVSVQPVPDSVGEAYLRVTDGRGNITRLWLDRLGSPTKLVNAVGNTTLIERGDPRFAGIATNVVQPNGHTVSASYDSHGNILANYDINPLGNGVDAVTKYHWDLRWDFADSIVGPGLTTTRAFDSQNGNRLWQQTGPDAARRVNFLYYTTGAAAGLFKSTVLPGTPADLLSYDGLGNPSAYTTSLGYLTQYFNDAIGRNDQTWQQVDVSGTQRTLRTVTQYDKMSRDTLTVVGNPDPAETSVGVRRTLDAAGDDSVVTRWSVPDPANLGNLVTLTLRDALGRVVKEVAPDGYADSTVYDEVGNVIKSINRNGDTVRFAYDSLNRMRRRATDLKHFDPEVIGLARGQLMSEDPVVAAAGEHGLSQTYPWNRPSGYDIAAQVDTFVYHPTDGTLTDANNAFAKVHFDYTPNGLVRVEQNSQGPWDGGTGPWHIYTNIISYDGEGRRSSLSYPNAIDGGGYGVTYSYSPSGELDGLFAFSPFVTSFTTNARGELTRKNFPGGSSQSFTYDHDGNLTSDTVMVGSSYSRGQRFTYDARGRRMSMTDNPPGVGFAGSDANSYNILGQLISNTNAIPGLNSTNNYTLDGFGNMTVRSGAEASLTWANLRSVQQTYNNDSEEWSFYKPGTGRLWYTKIVANPDTTGQSPGGGGRPAMMNWYDNAGNLIWTGAAILRLDGETKADAQSERRMYYGPDGKLRAVEARALYKSLNAPPGNGAPGYSRSFEEYRYDALGRRVATRFDQECDDIIDYNKVNAPCHVSGIRRTIWDGSQELGEIQLPVEHLENDYYVGQGTFTPSSMNLAPFYGAVAYAYDGKIDQPLAIKRLRYSNLTPSNTIVELAAFTYHPVWDVHGRVPTVVGYGSPPAPVCSETMAGGTKATCLSWVVNREWLPYRDLSTLWPRAWQGTLLEDKAGAGGLMYRRNRYYDSKSGRFTQEDPIGLAGGLNLYGFAGGDPVNFGDPFGLCPCLGSFVDPRIVFNMLSQMAFQALPYEEQRALVLQMAHGNASGPILVGSLLSGGGEVRMLFNGTRTALQALIKAGTKVEGISGWQGVEILRRMGSRSLGNVTVTSGEGTNVVLNMTKVYESGGREVTTAIISEAGQTTSLVRRIYDPAGKLITEHTIR